MTIYGVVFSDIQGYHTVMSNLFRLKSDALMEAAALAKGYNEEYGDSFDMQDDGLTWRSNYDTITVKEYKLI